MASRASLFAILILTLAAVGDSASARADAGPPSGTISPGLASSLDVGCPSPPGAPHGIQIWIHITQWCSLSAVRGQVQFKLQLQIQNRGKQTLGVTQEHMRLIVAEFDMSRWTPPRIGQPTTERPFRTTFEGKHVWAIPANAEDAFDPHPIAGLPDNKTFATHWGQSRLAPGRTFNPRYHLGDLVFYITYLPHDPHGAATSEDVLGMAYVYGREIVVMCPKERWGPREPAETF